jgi:ABC-type transporter Mla subunit MlaD
MPLETITREEFDRRLDAANERLRLKVDEIEEQQSKAEQLLSRYERALDEIEAELESADDSVRRPARLRKRLNELAEQTARVAASV